MSEYHARLLLELLARSRALSAEPAPPKWQTYRLELYKERLECGPDYSPSAWFGLHLDHERMRFHRAMRELVRDGLVELHARWGRRVSNARLTPEGWKVAEGLEAAKAQADHAAASP